MPQPPAPPLVQSNQERALEIIQAQINGVKAEIKDLTGQLTPGTSDARENAIEDQLSAANDRLESLQTQLDRAISGRTERVTAPPPDPNDIPRGVQNVIEMFFVSGVMVALGIPIVRMIARRFEPRPPATPDLSPRFERLEQAMDAVAIEVERISEGQRFTNKLLGDTRALPAPNPMEQWPLGQARVGEPVERKD